MRNVYLITLLAFGLLVPVSCVDDKYDLNDIDTTTAIKINDLTLPVRLNAITLDAVLDVEDSDVINVYEKPDGSKYYAIFKSGEFDAEPMFIDMLKAEDEATVYNIDFPVKAGNVESLATEFSYLISHVDESLESLSYFGLWEEDYMKITLNITPEDVVVSDVVLIIPSTFSAIYKGTEYTEGLIPVTVMNGELDQPVYITAMSFEPPLKPNESRELDIRGEIGIKSAKVESGNVPNLSVKFHMSPFTVDEVSGEIDYAVEAPQMAPVSLKDLPDFLQSGDTNLVLENPQLYLNLAYVNGADYKTYLSIIPEGEDTQPIDKLPISFGESIVLAPDTENLGLNLYDDPVLMDVEGLKYILSGKGLPTSIYFSLDETYVKGEISNLKLGEDKYMDGGYTFFSPLSFGEGSQIIYQKAETDFFGDDVEDVTVNHFRVQADVFSELPFDINLTLYPLDKEGKRIPGKNGWISGSSTVTPGSSYLDVSIEQEFKGLDGLEYVVETYDMTGETLNPEHQIGLDNIKATISGVYVTKL